MQPLTIQPQPGFQTEFLASPADIVVGGGAAGAGKSFALLLEALRHTANPRFNAIIFRRTLPQITTEGGLWSAAGRLFPQLGARARETDLLWRFPSGAAVQFGHLQHEKNIYDHQGAEYTFIGFDELTHFTERQFFYLLSRNRSLSGVRPYVRATCNPDPDSWVARLLNWWIDPAGGQPLPERAGRLRYFTRDGDALVWGDSPAEVVARCPHIFTDMGLADAEAGIKSLSFVPGSIYENRHLLAGDKGYLANLRAQDQATRAALLHGNWKARQSDLCLFDAHAITDLFTNYPPADARKFITADVARFGRDLTVIASWAGFEVLKLQVFTRSDITLTYKAIEAERQRLGVPAGHVLVDEDGVGGGVVDLGRYRGFTANATALNRENYANLKTQCYYRLAARLNEGGAACRAEVWVNGEQTDMVTLNGRQHPVAELIKADLRSARRDKPDADGKKHMLRKEAQKNLLAGRSPDFADALAMREYFELQPKTGVTWN